MRVITIAMYVVVAAIAATVLLTVTSSGRMGWDESALALVPLGVLFLVLRVLRQRAANREGA